MTHRHGFTLIELLVSIAIIALLISILLPTLSKARDAAKSISCLSNLKQSALSASLYAQDHDGLLELYLYNGQEYRWGRRLFQSGYVTVRDAFICPSANEPASFNWNHTYGSLMDLDSKDRIRVTAGVPRYTYLLLNDLKTPSNFFYLGDSVYTGDPSHAYFMLPMGSMYLSNANYSIHMLHNSSTGMAFADGHAELAGETRINSAANTMFNLTPEIWVLKDNHRARINP